MKWAIFLACIAIAVIALAAFYWLDSIEDARRRCARERDDGHRRDA